jgi:hypothetical protein
MGYHMHFRGARFLMKAEHKPAALEALQAMWTPIAMNELRPHGGGSSSRWYSWLNDTSLARGACDSFEQAMDDWRFPVSTDEHGNITGLIFNGEKIGDEGRMWAIIARYVEPGCYVEMEGEDGYHWRWVFDGETVTEVSAEVKFPT